MSTAANVGVILYNLSFYNFIEESIRYYFLLALTSSFCAHVMVLCTSSLQSNSIAGSNTKRCPTLMESEDVRPEDAPGEDTPLANRPYSIY